MADAKITALANNNTVDDTDLVVIVDDVSGTPASEKRTVAEIGDHIVNSTRVQTAGALMDSEVTNLADVKAFDPTDYATAAQGSTADSALQPSYVRAYGDVDALGNLGTSEAVNWANATHFTGTIDQSSLTITFSNAVAGQTITLYLAGSASASAITWPTITWLDNSSGSAPAVPGSGETLVVTLVYDGTIYYGSATGNFAVYA